MGYFCFQWMAVVAVAGGTYILYVTATATHQPHVLGKFRLLLWRDCNKMRLPSESDIAAFYFFSFLVYCCCCWLVGWWDATPSRLTLSHEALELIPANPNTLPATHHHHHGVQRVVY